MVLTVGGGYTRGICCAAVGRRLALLIGLLLIGASSVSAQTAGATALVLYGGKPILTAEFSQRGADVLVTIPLPNPPILPGSHGLQLHDNGRCDEPGYTTAGAMKAQLPNMQLDTPGVTGYQATLPRTQLSSLLGDDGTSLIVTANPDGGTAIACGVITAAQQTTARPTLGPLLIASTPTVVARPSPQPAVAQRPPVNQPTAPVPNTPPAALVAAIGVLLLIVGYAAGRLQRR
jgi:Cu-Zn family superoxide dismutase